MIEDKQELKEESLLLGNNNAAVGAKHKAMIGSRLSRPEDPLTQCVAQLAGIERLTDSCSLKSGESSGLAEFGSEIGMMASGRGNNGIAIDADVDVMAKTCAGLGSSNQTARMWAGSILSPAEFDGAPGKALAAICGALSLDGPTTPHVIPGHIIDNEYKKLGLPFQMWLAEPSTLARVCDKAFAVEASTPKGRKLLLVSMRSAGPDGEDIHLLVDRVDLRDYVCASAASKTKDGRSFVPIGISDEAVEFAKILRLKRKGGDSGNKNSNQIQLTISPRELLAAIGSKKLKGFVLSEEPTSASLEIEELARNGRALVKKEVKSRHEHMGLLIKRCAKVLVEEARVNDPARPSAKM